MPKKALKKLMVDPAKLKTNPSLQFLGKYLLNGNVWHLNRHSASKGALFGLFFALIPMPFQMVPAAILSIMYRGNLPLCMGLVWLTNPITWLPVFYVTYKLGAYLMGLEPIPFTFSDLSLEVIIPIWKPLYLGSFVAATVSSISAYLAIRMLWRWKIVSEWKHRKERRHKRHHS